MARILRSYGKNTLNRFNIYIQGGVTSAILKYIGVARTSIAKANSVALASINKIMSVLK